MKNKRFYIYLIISISLSVFIIVNAFISGDNSGAESNLIADICRSIINTFKANTINDSNYASFASFIRKFVGHFSLFAVTGFFSFLTLKNYHNEHLLSKYAYVNIYGLLLAVISELIQTIIPGRFGSVEDVIIDTRGFLFATSIILIICLLINKRMNNKQSVDNI